MERTAGSYVWRVIGAGVIGLSCAVKLQAKLANETDLRGFNVVLVAREWPSIVVPGAPTPSVNFASMWAGAHVRPIPATTPQLQREARWVKQTAGEFDRLLDAAPFCGITRTVGIEYIEDPCEGYLRQSASAFEEESGLVGYHRMDPSELPEGVSLGFRYETFCINPSIYCENLLRKFLFQGGKTMMMNLSSEWEPFAMKENVVLVVNASGMGFGDHKCFPTRGQTVLTDLSVTSTVTRQNKDGTWSFLVPRFFNGGTVVGGTKEPGDWRDAVDVATRNRLLTSGLAIESGAPQADSSQIDDVKVLSDIVGRRPTREGGMRLEVEQSKTGRVIHAYGAGGRGYELSWGVASEVVQLAVPLLLPAEKGF